MSLDLLKERFGHSSKKGKDNKEKIHETLNGKFNSNGIDELKDFKVQHQEELDEKQRIIENLESETSNLTHQVLTLENEKSVILEELNRAKWLENNIAGSTKQIYEDKIKRMSIVDSTNLIPMLMEVSRKKQGLNKLNWGDWLEISENKYLLQINESIAKKVFEDTNRLIDEAVNNINKKKNRVSPVDTDYVLTFTGDTAAGARFDYVSTTFNPDSYDGAGTGLNRGFTVSYWVKSLEDVSDSPDVYIAWGKRSQANGAFQFGVKNANKIKIGVGSADKDDNTHPDGIGWEAGDDNVAHGVNDGEWHHWTVTYGGDDHSSIGGDRQVRVWIDGVEILKNGASGGGMGIANWVPGWQNCDEGCDDAANDASNIYFGGRANFNGLDNDPPTSYNQGWACSLSEVAIYNVEKDEDGTFAREVYNAGWGYNHSGNSGLVGYWKFNEGSGTTVTDYGPYQKHGTLTSDADQGGSGTPTWTKNGSYK